MQTTTPDLRDAYAQARREGAARHRDIAQQLGVSEGELIAAHVSPLPGNHALHARRLRPEWPRIVAALEAVGPVMALTRNASCVHEKTGVYSATSASGPAGAEVGLVLGGDIDLRLFYSHWAHSFAVDELGPRGLQRSLQFFSADGTAVHKVFFKPATQLEAWVELVLQFMAAEQQPGLLPRPKPPRAAEKPDDAVDVPAFRQAWASLRDTHEFFGLLKAHGLSRTQALRLAGEQFARPVDAASAQQLLAAAAARGVPLMVFTGSAGCIQIHSGPVHKVVVMEPWLNVLDPGFNLHLREDHIAAAWVVKKPTVDGLVTSLELFDREGETITMFFGERKPGRPELCEWRELIDALMGDAISPETDPCLR
jgi:putative hemin transport protein